MADRLHGRMPPVLEGVLSRLTGGRERNLLAGQVVVARIVVDGKDASEAIIAAGLGCTYHPHIVDPALDAALDRAKTAKLGFWAAGARQPACVLREAQTRSAPPLTTASGFVGNVSSKVYHLPTCRNASCANCARTFATGAAAEAAGFKRAGDCLGR